MSRIYMRSEEFISSYSPLVVMGCSVRVPVFTDTSLGTRIALSVSPNITSGDFMRELEKTHFNCFPELGEIRVHGLMVKRRSCFYHVPDSLPIKHAFQGLKGTWFLCTEANSLGGSNISSLSKHVTLEKRNHTSDGSDITDPIEPKSYTAFPFRDKKKCKGRRRRTERDHCLKAVLWGLVRTVCFSRKSRRKRVKKNCYLACVVNDIENGCPVPSTKGMSGFCTLGNEEEDGKEWISKMVECYSEKSSEVISVTSIIERYFSKFDDMNYFGGPSPSEVTSRVIFGCSNEQLGVTADGNCSNMQIGLVPSFPTKTPARKTLFSSTNSIPERAEVGKRLVGALNTLGVSSSNQRSAISINRFKDGKLLGPDSAPVRGIVFEMSDDDD